MSFFIETSWCSHNHFGQELCGDKVVITKDENGVLLVLSDGLGSGVKANILASLTSKIISTMINAGANIQDVVETIASTLPVCREREIAYSTFTFIKVDPEGNAYLVEYDNPTVILLRNGKRVYIPWIESCIAGKMIRQAHIKLQMNDIVIIFSDGVVHAGVGQVLNFGWLHENVVEYLESSASPNDRAIDVSHRLLDECYHLYNGQCGDDTTVAVIRACEPVPCCVMVGPPVNPLDDEQAVNELLSCKGIKVVMGGTTSHIVSKLTGRDLKISLDYLSSDVPPIAKMEGIDLVTQGVVTLGKVLEILQEYAATQNPEVLYRGKNGAYLLSQILAIKATSVRIICGRALNPAHQNPDMPISLSIKLRLVKDISNCLQRLGRPVSVRYC